MASGPYPDPRRGTWSVQWFDGTKWRRPTVVKKKPGWKPGDPMPKKPPAAAVEALAVFTAKEEAARGRRRKFSSPDRTLADFLADYEAEYRSSRASGSVLGLSQVVRRFLAWCQGAGVVRLQDVTPAVCRSWLQERAAETNPYTGKSTAYNTMAKEVALLAAAWAKAVKFEELDRNPWKHVEVPAKRSAKAKGSWTPDEFARLLPVCRPWLQDLLTLGCNTGIRINALIHLEWRDVEWNEAGGTGLGFVIVRSELDKAGKGYRVPMTRAAHDLLARRLAARRGDCDRVLTGMRGRPVSGRRETADSIVRACGRAGLGKPVSPNHHMRRSFGRWAVLGQLTGRPIPLYVVSRWMGHASVAMTQRYLDIRDEESSSWMEEVTPLRCGE